MASAKRLASLRMNFSVADLGAIRAKTSDADAICRIDIQNQASYAQPAQILGCLSAPPLRQHPREVCKRQCFVAEVQR